MLLGIVAEGWCLLLLGIVAEYLLTTCEEATDLLKEKSISTLTKGTSSEVTGLCSGFKTSSTSCALPLALMWCLQASRYLHSFMVLKIVESLLIPSLNDSSCVQSRCCWYWGARLAGQGVVMSPTWHWNSVYSGLILNLSNFSSIMSLSWKSSPSSFLQWAKYRPVLINFLC